MFQFQVLLLVTVLSFISCDLSCQVPVHYEQVGCTPVPDVAGGCPKSYNCDHVWSRSNDVCYGDFGTQFAVGDSFPFPINMTAHYVFTTFAFYDTCTCKPKSEYRDAVIDCNQIQTPPYKEVLASEAVCTVEGRFYKNGDQIFPQNPKYCTKSYCRTHGIETLPLSCGFGVFTDFSTFKNSIPSYGYNNCCPSRWRSVRDDEEIVPAKKPVASDLRCKVGSLSLKLGESLSFDRATCSNCRCELPPIVTCVIDESCRPAVYH